jgi:hypothetical protein
LEQISPLLRPEQSEFIEIPTEINCITNCQGSDQSALKNTKEYDSFYTPSNGEFYSARPYTQLNDKLKEFRLLRVHPRKTCWQHYETHPGWDAGQASGLNKNQEILACEIEKTSLTRVGDNYTTLSWTPQMLVCSNQPNNMPSRRETYQGVELLQRLLLKLLGGKDEDEKLRTIAPEPTATIEYISNDEDPSIRVTATAFQSSLASFITNPWWRRYVGPLQAGFVASLILTNQVLGIPRVSLCQLHLLHVRIYHDTMARAIPTR